MPAAQADSYTFTTIGSPDGSVRGINDAGDIVATAGQNSIAYGLPNQLQTISLPFSTTYTEPSGINDNGDIVGGYAPTSTDYHGFLLRNGILTTIDVPGASTTFLSAINDPGDMVGFSQRGKWISALWRDVHLHQCSRRTGNLSRRNQQFRRSCRLVCPERGR